MSGILGMFPGGGKSAGQYAWKKSTPSIVYADGVVSTKGAVYLERYESAIKVYYSNSYTFDKETGMYTLVSPSYYTIAPGHTQRIDYGKYFIPFGTSGTRMFKAHASAGPTVHHNLVKSTYITPYSDAYPLEVHAAANMPYPEDFMEYTVADNSDTYPDCAIHTDGYLYRKASRGQYAWKVASSYYQDIATNIGSSVRYSFTEESSGTISYYVATDYTFDAYSGLFTLVNPTKYTLALNTDVNIYGKRYVIPFAPSGQKMCQAISDTSPTKLANTSAYGVYAINNGTSHTSVLSSSMPYGFVTSDNENEYPDFGSIDGLTYTKISYE